MQTKLKRKDSLIILYYKYKESALFTTLTIPLLFVLSIIIIVTLVLPQLQKWFSIQDEVKSVQDNIQTLKDNQNFVLSVDRTKLTDDLGIVSQALPFEKDFSATLKAISNATVVSGVVLDDYSFQVGTISSASASTNRDSITIQLSIQGTVNEIITFLDEIYKQVPLAEIYSVRYEEGGATITLIFNYKISSPNIKIVYTKKLLPINSARESLVSSIRGWIAESQNIPAIVLPDPTTPIDTGAASGSATTSSESADIIP